MTNAVDNLMLGLVIVLLAIAGSCGLADAGYGNSGEVAETFHAD